jgi:hypothetical protein
MILKTIALAAALAMLSASRVSAQPRLPSLSGSYRIRSDSGSGMVLDGEVVVFEAASGYRAFGYLMHRRATTANYADTSFRWIESPITVADTSGVVFTSLQGSQVGHIAANGAIVLRSPDRSAMAPWTTLLLEPQGIWSIPEPTGSYKVEATAGKSIWRGSVGLSVAPLTDGRASPARLQIALGGGDGRIDYSVPIEVVEHSDSLVLPRFAVRGDTVYARGRVAAGQLELRFAIIAPNTGYAREIAIVGQKIVAK